MFPSIRHPNNSVIFYLNVIPILLVNTFHMLMNFLVYLYLGLYKHRVSPFLKILHFPSSFAAHRDRPTISRQTSCNSHDLAQVVTNLPSQFFAHTPTIGEIPMILLVNYPIVLKSYFAAGFATALAVAACSLRFAPGSSKS